MTLASPSRFARGRSQNAPTDRKNLLRSKQIISPDRFLSLPGLVVLFDKLEFNGIYNSFISLAIIATVLALVSILMVPNV